MRHALWMAAILVAGAAASAQATGIGPDVYGYTAAETAFSWVDISGTGTQTLPLANDYQSGYASLGFNFSFYGTTYTNVYWTENGLITFGGVNTQSTEVDLTIASPNVDIPTIAPLWDDWKTFGLTAQGYLANEGVWYKKVVESSGSQSFVLQWRVQHNNASDTFDDQQQVEFEVVLYEGSNDILFNYKDVVASTDGLGDWDNGKSATVGIRDTGGQTNGENLQWSFDGQRVIRDGESILFSAPPVPEPVTMAGVFLGIGSLATYLRKRRAA